MYFTFRNIGMYGCSFLVVLVQKVKLFWQLLYDASGNYHMMQQVTSGEYILWNTLGKCPVAATPKA